MAGTDILDASAGDPLFPLTSVANHAFRMTRKDLNRYQFMAAGNSAPSVRAALSSIADYFTGRGIYAPGWSGLGLRDMLVTGGGTTAGFNLVMQMLAGDVRRENEARGRSMKPAILMPVPNYGYFADAAREQGLGIIPVRRDMKAGGALSRDALLEAIKTSLADKDVRIVGYYDSNPNNPLGLIRTEAETRAIGEVLQALTLHYQERDQIALEERLKNVREIPGMMGMMIKPGSGYRWQGPASRVRMIDDMVYDGLEYGAKKPFAFAQIDEFYKDTITLAGPSKAGLVNVRAGVVIADARLIEHLSLQSRMQEYFPSKPALHALEAFFNAAAPFADRRERHLQRMNRAHQCRGMLMKALINGTKTMPELTAPEHGRIENAVMKHEGCDRKKARKLLENGVRDVRVVTSPEAGFFHLLDFSALKGKIYPDSLAHYKVHSGWAKVESEKDIHTVFGSGQNLRMASGTWSMLEPEDMMVRVSFALPVAQIFDLRERLRQGLKHFRNPVMVKGSKPEQTPG